MLSKSLKHDPQKKWLTWCFFPDWGMPFGGPSGNQPNRSAAAAPTGLPPVLKDEKASEVILKYMDGLLKRSQKVSETWIQDHKW